MSPAASRRPRPLCAAVALGLGLAALTAGCRTARPPAPPGERGRPFERGLASWYGPGFDGRPTASGEIFDTRELTAAHRTLPFGTLVEVVNLDNGRSVRVRINDRGPFVRRRIIDLSRAAAEVLGLIGPGVAPVELYLVAGPAVGTPGGRAAPAAQEAGAFTVQVGAFAEPERAAALRDELARQGYAEVRVRSDGTWHRVQVESFAHRREAEDLRRELARRGYPALVVRLSPGG